MQQNISQMFLILVLDSATYILDILIDLFHACFATLLVPRHHVDKLLIGFFIVRVGLNLVNLDFAGIELDLGNLFSKNKGVRFDAHMERVADRRQVVLESATTKDILTKRALTPPHARPTTALPMIM